MMCLHQLGGGRPAGLATMMVAAVVLSSAGVPDGRDGEAYAPVHT